MPKQYTYIEDIDRAFEYALEKELTRIGWYPDKDAFLATQDQQGFFAAVEALKSAGTFAEVFGVGNYKDRKELKRNHIIVDRGTQSPSEGNFTQSEAAYVEYDDDGQPVYERYRLSETPEDIIYTISLVCNDKGAEAVLTTAIYNALGYRKQLVPIDSDRQAIDSLFLTVRLSVADTSGTDYIEKTFNYEARDLVILQEVLEEPRIAKITELEMNIVPDHEASADSEGGATINEELNN